MADSKTIFQEDYKYVQSLLLGESEAWNRFYNELRKKLGIYLKLLPKGISELISVYVKRMRLLSQDLNLTILVTLADYRDKTEVF